MPEFAVLIYAADARPAPEPGSAAPGRDPDEHDRHADELAASGAMRLAYAFTSRASAVSVSASGTTAGPFLGDAPIVAGIYILEAPDLDAAVAIARTNPAVGTATGGVEVRPVEGGGLIG